MYYGLPAIALRINRAIEPASTADTSQNAPSRENAAATGPAAFFSRVGERVRPAVVRVDALQFFESPENQPSHPGDVQTSASGQSQIFRGCGLVIDRQGLVLTSRRVVAGATLVRVHLARHARPFFAQIAGSDAVTDLAVLRFEPPAEGMAVAALEEAEPLEIGEYVIAVGNAYEPGEFLWVGVVNANGGKTAPACCDIRDCISTAAANPWNCGGPLLNLNGRIVGIGTSLQDRHDLSLGVAVPAYTARRVVEELLSRGQVSRGWLGVFVHKDSPEPEAGLSDGSLCLAVDYVVPDSPAAKAGIRAGDAITKMDGTALRSAGEFRKRIAGSAPGSEVVVTIQREREFLDRKITITRLPETPPALPGEREWGIRLLGHLSTEEAKFMGLEHLAGVVVQEVMSRRKASELAGRDVILAVNDVPTPNLEIFCREVSRLCECPAPAAVTLEVVSQGVRKRIVIGGGR